MIIDYVKHCASVRWKIIVAFLVHDPNGTWSITAAAILLPRDLTASLNINGRLLEGSSYRNRTRSRECNAAFARRISLIRNSVFRVPILTVTRWMRSIRLRLPNSSVKRFSLIKTIIKSSSIYNSIIKSYF